MFRNVQADQLPPEAQLDLKQQPATDEDVQGRPRHGVYEDLADQVRGHDEPRRMWSRLRDETANRDAATGRKSYLPIGGPAASMRAATIARGGRRAASYRENRLTMEASFFRNIRGT